METAGCSHLEFCNHDRGHLKNIISAQPEFCRNLNLLYGWWNQFNTSSTNACMDKPVALLFNGAKVHAKLQIKKCKQTLHCKVKHTHTLPTDSTVYCIGNLQKCKQVLLCSFKVLQRSTLHCIEKRASKKVQVHCIAKRSMCSAFHWRSLQTHYKNVLQNLQTCIFLQVPE